MDYYNILNYFDKCFFDDQLFIIIMNIYCFLTLFKCLMLLSLLIILINVRHKL